MSEPNTFSHLTYSSWQQQFSNHLMVLFCWGYRGKERAQRWGSCEGACVLRDSVCCRRQSSFGSWCVLCSTMWNCPHNVQSSYECFQFLSVIMPLSLTLQHFQQLCWPPSSGYVLNLLTVWFAYRFISIQCTVFALTVHFLLESHAALWLWNDALFDCQPREEEIRNGKGWVQQWLPCPPWKLRIVLCSD